MAFQVQPMQRLDFSGLNQAIGTIGRVRAMERQKEEQAAKEQAALESRQALGQEATRLFQEGTPEEMFSFGIQNPEFGQRLNEAVGYKSEQTQNAVGDTIQRALSNPNQRADILEQGALEVERLGGNPVLLREAMDDTPEEFEKAALMNLSASPRGQAVGKAYLEARGGIGELGSDVKTAEWYRTATPEQRKAFDQTKRGSKKPIEQQIEDAERLAAVRIEEAQTTTERKQGVSDLSAITKAAKASRQQIITIIRLVKLNEKAFAGAGSESALAIAKVGDRLGINIDGLSESEQFQAIGNTLVLDKSQQMSGALSNADMEFLRNTVPNLNNTKEGRSQMLEFAKKIQQREVEYSRAAQRFRKEKGYFNQSEFDSEYQRFADENPLFDGEASKEASKYTEGQTATNPSTGQKMVYRGGQWQMQ